MRKACLVLSALKFWHHLSRVTSRHPVLSSVLFSSQACEHGQKDCGEGEGELGERESEEKMRDNGGDKNHDVL